MIINYHINLCKWLDGTMENKFLDILLDDLKKAANFIHSCPHAVSIAIVYQSSNSINDFLIQGPFLFEEHDLQ